MFLVDIGIFPSLNCFLFPNCIIWHFYFLCTIFLKLFQDGFCDGETLDGRRGLIPSNFIQKLIGDDLLEFHQSVVMHLRDGEDCHTTTVPHDIDLGAHSQSFLGKEYQFKSI